MCVDPSLSDKERYPTFARTEPIGRQLTPAINEILSYFKWRKFALIVENSTMYQRAFKMIKEKFNVHVLAEAFMPPPAKYSYDEHYVKAREDMRKLKDKARSKWVRQVYWYYSCFFSYSNNSTIRTTLQFEQIRE